MGEEDCLYLNIYTPKVGQKLSVMVYIHGGGWLAGNGNRDSYGPEYLMDHNIILVTMNYRLGPLGFLSTEDGVAPGNYGLKDQQLALKWVQKYIKYFGGNPDSVTLFGQSAGAASTNYHMLSKGSRGNLEKKLKLASLGVKPYVFLFLKVFSIEQFHTVALLSLNGHHISKVMLEK